MTCVQGRIFKGSCRGHHIKPLEIHSIPLPGRVVPWCYEWDIAPCKTNILQISESFLNLCRELKLWVPAVKGYTLALSHVFTVAGTDLVAAKIISRM